MAHLDPPIRRRIFAALDRFVADTAGSDTTYLKGTENEYRLRVGDWRVRYRPVPEELLIVVLHVGHRKEFY